MTDIDIIDPEEGFEVDDDDSGIIYAFTKAEEMQNGGYRQDRNRNTYWLSMEQLRAYEKADQTITDDKAFWDWFDEYREKAGVAKRRGRVWDEFSGAVTKKKDYLTGWWKDYGWSKDDDKGYSGSSSYKGGAYQGGSPIGSADSRRLAMATDAISTTVRVINESDKRYRVRLASEELGGPENYTSFDEKLIVVSPRALLDKKVDEAESIRITTGWACHEASHVQYTTDVYEDLKEPPMMPQQISYLGANILEDDRIERLTADKFPGFSSYFDAGNDYMWDVQEPHAPTQWDGDLANKTGVIILSARWPEQYEDIVRAGGDAQAIEMFEWVQPWRDAYLDGSVGLRDSVQALLDKLNADPQTQKQMKDLEDQEKQAGLNGTLTDEEFQGLMEQLKKQNGLDKFQSCSSSGTPIKLTPQQAKEIQDLLERQVSTEKIDLHFPDVYTGVEPEIYWDKPQETPESKGLWQKPGPIVNRLKGAFFFRKPRPMFSERQLKSGMIDDDELWKVGAGDFNIFERRVIEDQPETQVTMLIDSSGSMYGEGLQNAQMLANVMLECLKSMKGIRVRVRSHSTGGERDSNGGYRNFSVVDRIWEPGDPQTRIGLLNSDEIPHGSNWDGFAIIACAEEMIRESRQGEDMILFVLSDGLPNGAGEYSGHPAMQHMRKVTDHYISKGLMVVQIAVSDDIRPSEQAIMYRYWLGYENEHKLPRQMADLLIKLFGGA